jgi:hypothetical protein
VYPLLEQELGLGDSDGCANALSFEATMSQCLAIHTRFLRGVVVDGKMSGWLPGILRSRNARSSTNPPRMVDSNYVPFGNLFSNREFDEVLVRFIETFSMIEAWV